MTDQIEWVALSVFIFFFALVTVMGFFAARWKAGPVSEHLDEWGLGGRQFSTWITWFLVGGDFYTAYTVIAVPALVYAVGAYGFFALPYTVIVYPFVFAVMPVLWKVAHANGHVTAADVVHGAYNSRGLELAVAITGMVATMPYIALQLIGMGVVIKAMGLTGELPIVAAFVILALLAHMAYAAHIKVDTPNDVVPMLFKALFPSWFAGFAFSAIAIGALVPAAVMSIGAANLFTRNVWKSYVNPDVSHAGEAAVAKIASLVVKVGALAFILFLPTQYALDLQLLGGLWILQTFPALVFGLFTRWFRAEGLLLGWAAGIIWGSWTAWSNGLKPLASIELGGASYMFYVGLGALILNVVVAV